LITGRRHLLSAGDQVMHSMLDIAVSHRHHGGDKAAYRLPSKDAVRYARSDGRPA
jgi:hypothetical protein